MVKTMYENGVKQLIFISSIGIYEMPLKPVLKPYRAAADVIENSDLDYTILRPAWFTSDNEIDYEITKKGEPERGSVISRKSIASFIGKIIDQPSRYKRQNLGINKPKSFEIQKCLIVWFERRNTWSNKYITASNLLMMAEVQKKRHLLTDVISAT